MFQQLADEPVRFADYRPSRDPCPELVRDCLVSGIEEWTGQTRPRRGKQQGGLAPVV